MNKVTKFTSKDEFNYQSWLNGNINEAIKEAENKYKTEFTDIEKVKIIDILMKEGITLHFYFSARITSKDLKMIRKEDKKEVVKSPKCKRCKIRLDRPIAGKHDGIYCEECIEELKAVSK